MTFAREDPTARGEAAAILMIKAVPGASRDSVAGVLGDRLKVRVAAPPEGGRANAAICRVVAERLGVKARQVEVVSGHSGAEKTLRVIGLTAAQVRDLLA